ncbi:response regulator [Pelagicoccus sp. SDUM812002]|uniref:response regulator n=1 Tax=Pelagicoccus sp. SDUM812002 TaxID=3041266 RepID=UPI00280F1D05|nr:response regulator [Pelagicoccus sp. SDUM812002]MDQ8187306.1 response regulator [Pelagicoccus sp. SDUM812002]
MTESNRYRILYIDDESQSLQAFRRTFSDVFEVHIASNCQEGLEILRNHRIQLIVADQRMPDETGVEFLKKVRSLYPLVIRTILTGYSDIEAVIEAINHSHVYHYFKKPWNEEELKIVFRNAIEAVELTIENTSLSHDLKDALGELEKNAETLEFQLAERQDLIDQLETSNNAKSRFLSTISHELRTPLNPIIGFTDMMLAKEPEGEFASCLEMINRCGHDMLTMIDSILEFIQVEKGQTLGKIKPTNLNHILLDSRDLAISLVDDRPIRIELTFQHNGEKVESLPEVLSWFDPLRQILFNLVSNACKFTDEGFISITANLIDLAGDKSQLEIHVKDSGIGIKSQDRDNIFDLFTQIDQSISRRHSGLGLGLAICRQQAKRIEAEIDLESELGVGSLFKLRLLVHPIEETSQAPQTHDTLAPTTLIGKNCLVIDDNPTDLSVTSSMLESIGAHVNGSQKGETALHAFTEQKIDWVFISYSAQDSGSAELIQKIIDLKLAPLSHIVPITNDPEETARPVLQAMGIKSCLRRPFELKGLLRSVVK